MDNNWIVENLTNAFGVWNSKMTEMWSLLTESPQTFKGGNDYEIYNDERTIGHSVTCPEDTMKLLDELFLHKK